MWLFSGKGDEGSTSLFDGRKIQKSELVFELIGSLDEATAHIGLAISLCEDFEIITDLGKIQDVLSKLMGVIAGAGEAVIAGRLMMDEVLDWLENRIKYYGRDLDNPKSFIYAGKTTFGSSLDITRTVIRRCERIAVRYSKEVSSIKVEILPFINRLSSYFYTLRIFVDQ